MKIVELKDLQVSFDTYAGEVQAVRGVSYYVNSGEVLAVVGESGSGKSVTAQTIMKLNPMPPARIKSGSIILDGHDIVNASESDMQDLRGRLVSMIFQDPMSSLNPTMKVGDQIAETIRLHQKISKSEASLKAIEALEQVQIPNAKQRAQQYPHQYSGGMRQRAMIAMALSCNPKLLIADEPTTALDVTIQAQILDLLAQLRKNSSMGIILITHDLGVVANLADRIAVMYAGIIVETGESKELFANPCHPYTLALLSSMPKQDHSRLQGLVSIAGSPPDLIQPPIGCAFGARCDKTMDICLKQTPPNFTLKEGHEVACWLHHPSCTANKEGIR